MNGWGWDTKDSRIVTGMRHCTLESLGEPDSGGLMPSSHCRHQQASFAGISLKIIPSDSSEISRGGSLIRRTRGMERVFS